MVVENMCFKRVKDLREFALLVGVPPALFVRWV